MGEDLIAALTISEWPGRNPYSQRAWEKFSWPSKKSLLPQYADMIKRHGQLTSWTETLATPISVWLSGLFNPMAYLTSILQVTARAAEGAHAAGARGLRQGRFSATVLGAVGRRLSEARRRRLRGARLHHDRARRDLRVPGHAQDGRAQEQVDAHGHGAHDAAGRLVFASPSEV